MASIARHMAESMRNDFKQVVQDAIFLLTTAADVEDVEVAKDMLDAADRKVLAAKGVAQARIDQTSKDVPYVRWTRG